VGIAVQIGAAAETLRPEVRLVRALNLDERDTIFVGLGGADDTSAHGSLGGVDGDPVETEAVDAVDQGQNVLGGVIAQRRGKVENGRERLLALLGQDVVGHAEATVGQLTAAQMLRCGP
tara:strand:+ start:1171 stop:1527 length:357 start_codon:yes stop_codon:yes gene_type:complete